MSNSYENITIGVLALQGAFREHRMMLDTLGVKSREIRLPEHLKNTHGLIIPGGESTTIGKLLVEWKLLAPIKKLGKDEFPIWGTCAGAILLAEKVIERGNTIDQHLLELLPMTAIRNAFGRQKESFEADIAIKGLESDYRAVFIRAPLMNTENSDIETLATVDDEAVFVKKGNLIATSFHPELTDDTRIHRFFANLVLNAKTSDTID